MAGTITIKDVALHADVSVGTVSRVFNNHTNVTDEIRQRVLRAASDLGYYGRMASDMQARGAGRPAMIKEIGFLFYSLVKVTASSATSTNTFWSHILEGAENEARKSNIKIIYHSIEDVIFSPDLLLTTIYEMRLGGILLVGPTDREMVNLIQTTKLPLVLVDNYITRLLVDSIQADSFEGMCEAVEYLISQGHREIAFIGGQVLEGPRPTNKIYSIERRVAGYRTALLDAGLPMRYELYEASDLVPESGYEACKRLLARNIPFTALVCANDAAAIGALKALREAGLRVPEDISLIGFDDIDIMQHLTPAVTTVRVPKEALGSTAVRSLLTRAADMEAVNVSSILGVELIKRDSVMPPRGNR